MHRSLVYLPLNLGNNLARKIYALSRRQGCSMCYTVESILKNYLEDFDAEDIPVHSMQDLDKKKNIGIKICQLRQINYLSQATLAKSLGMNQRTISRIETGERRLDLIEAASIAKFFNISVDELLL